MVSSGIHNKALRAVKPESGRISRHFRSMKSQSVVLQELVVLVLRNIRKVKLWVCMKKGPKKPKLREVISVPKKINSAIIPDDRLCCSSIIHHPSRNS